MSNAVTTYMNKPSNEEILLVLNYLKTKMPLEDGLSQYLSEEGRRVVADKLDEADEATQFFLHGTGVSDV